MVNSADDVMNSLVSIDPCSSVRPFEKQNQATTLGNGPNGSLNSLFDLN